MLNIYYSFIIIENMKIIKVFLIMLLLVSAYGCGKRVIGNPGSYSYEEYSDYRDYREGKLREAEQVIKTQNPQSFIPNQPLIGQPKCNFNKRQKN